MSNLEKYRMYERTIDQITNSFCESLFPDGYPARLYDLGMNFNLHKYGSYIREAEVDVVDYRLTGKLTKPYFNKRPSKDNVERIKDIAESMPNMDLLVENVLIHVREGHGFWARPYTDLAMGTCSLDRTSMEPKLLAATERYISTYLVGDGQFACAYCRKATDVSNKIVGTIISRQYTNFRKQFDYCSNECATHDQCAHEG